MIVVFFFQAEDGIRDGHVTGVQTCALPISIGLILNELISNSFKYAFDMEKGGHLEVALKKQNGTIHLKVSDNGRGLPDTFSIENTKTLGYRLVKAFADKLKATLTMGHSPAGTVVSMSIPDQRFLY